MTMNSLLQKAANHFLELVDLGERERATRLSEIHAADPLLGEEVRTLLDPGWREASLALHESFAAGVSLGKFEIIEELGRGAMGTVYKVRDTTTNHIHALKLLSPNKSDANILDEIDTLLTAGGTPHPNLVPIRESGRTVSGHSFFTMDYMEGGDLAFQLERGKTHYTEILRWMHQVATALAYLHREKIVHLDIKPANIFIDAKGNARLGDFSIARVHKRNEALTALNHTQVGGSYYYMAPEQWKVLKRRDLGYEQASEATCASDCCSFGLTLYHLITGEVLIGDRQEMAGFLVGNEPSGRFLDDFLSRCLARDPGDRFCDGEEMLLAYENMVARMGCLDQIHPSGSAARSRLDVLRAQLREAAERRAFWSAHKTRNFAAARQILWQLNGQNINTEQEQIAWDEWESSLQEARSAFEDSVSENRHVDSLQALGRLLALRSDFDASDELDNALKNKEQGMWKSWAHELFLPDLADRQIRDLIEGTRGKDNNALHEMVGSYEYGLGGEEISTEKARLIMRFLVERGDAQAAFDLSETYLDNPGLRKRWLSEASRMGHRQAGRELADFFYRNGHKGEARYLYQTFGGKPPISGRMIGVYLAPVLFFGVLLLGLFVYQTKLLTHGDQMETSLKNDDLIGAIDHFAAMVPVWGGMTTRTRQLTIYILEKIALEEEPDQWGTLSNYADEGRLAQLVTATEYERLVPKLRNYMANLAGRKNAEITLKEIFHNENKDFKPADKATMDTLRKSLDDQYGTIEINTILGRYDKTREELEGYRTFCQNLFNELALAKVSAQRLKQMAQNLSAADPAFVSDERLMGLLSALAGNHEYHKKLARFEQVLSNPAGDLRDRVFKIAGALEENNLEPSALIAIGGMFEDHLENAKQKQLTIENLNLEVANRNTDIAGLQRDLVEKQTKIASQERTLVQRGARISSLLEHISGRETFWKQVVATNGRPKPPSGDEQISGLETAWQFLGELRLGNKRLSEMNKTLSTENHRLIDSLTRKRDLLRDLVDRPPKLKNGRPPAELASWIGASYASKMVRMLASKPATAIKQPGKEHQ